MFFYYSFLFFFQAEDGIRDGTVTGVQTCALPILSCSPLRWSARCAARIRRPDRISTTPSATSTTRRGFRPRTRRRSSRATRCAPIPASRISCAPRRRRACSGNEGRRAPRSGAWLFRLPVQRFDEHAGCRARGGRVLTGNQRAVDDRVNAPVLNLGKGGTEAHQFVLHEEGHHLRQSHLFFLAIGKAGHVLAF